MNYLAKFVSENQRNWDRWIGLCLLAYRSARHEVTKISLAEMCFGRELKLSLDLLRGISPQKLEFVENNYVSQLRSKLYVIHEGDRQQLDLRSQKVKVLYDSKVRRLLFETGQRVWLFNPQRIKGRSYKIIGKSLMRSSDG